MSDSLLYQELLSLADPDYRKFQSALIPGLPPEQLLGVRLPALRKIAKRLAKGDYLGYLNMASDGSFEEIMLQGMVIGYRKAETKGELDELLDCVRRFVPKISNWSVCDSFCSGLKLPIDWPEEMFQFLSVYLNSREEYELRFSLVMLLFYYIKEELLESLYDTFNRVCLLPGELFYARMAVAWAVSICFARFPDRTMQYLKTNSMDEFTYRKSLQKIIESRQVPDSSKETIRAMKRQE